MFLINMNNTLMSFIIKFLIIIITMKINIFNINKQNKIKNNLEKKFFFLSYSFLINQIFFFYFFIKILFDILKINDFKFNRIY